jgi:2-(1,2-epoxy-1,2-dihydrophenyl)acetyl-CoA isomerase
MSREQQDIELFNGRITEEKPPLFLQHWLRVEDVDVAFICGPEDMMHGVSNALQEAGMPKERIRIELFAASIPKHEHKPRQVDAAAARHQTEVTVIMDGNHASFTMDKDKESLLDAGLRAGIDMRYSCKGGVCSTCRCKVLEGKVDMDVNYALEDYEVARGFVLSCQSFPVTDKIVVILTSTSTRRESSEIKMGSRLRGKTGDTHDYESSCSPSTDGIAVLTLNRPDRLNSFTQAMHREVRDALDKLQADKSVRVLVLTGAGRGFCAGQDLSDRAVEPGAPGVDLGESVEKFYAPLVLTLRALPMPVICAVNGVAAGAGANLALACDIVLAAKSASFIEAFCKLGLIPDTGGTWHLPRLIGPARAMGLAMLGDKLPAEKAEQWGLIWRCVPDEALMDEAMAMAEHFASAPTKGLAFTKKPAGQLRQHPARTAASWKAA